MTRFPAAAVLSFLLFASSAHADIYRWEDDSGTAHFTDDISNIPAAHRGRAKTVVREGPPGSQPPSPAPPARGTSQPPAGTAPAGSESDARAERDAGADIRERESLRSQVEQLKAKIAAKEALMKSVDDRRNLALNPGRIRTIGQADAELYTKYESELPYDRERLQELENRLQTFR